MTDDELDVIEAKAKDRVAMRPTDIFGRPIPGGGWAEQCLALVAEVRRLRAQYHAAKRGEWHCGDPACGVCSP